MRGSSKHRKDKEDRKKGTGKGIKRKAKRKRSETP